MDSFISILSIVLQVILVASSLLLILLILLHRGKGGGLSDMFGGGVSATVGSSGVAEKNLNRITVWIALFWVGSIIAIVVMTKLQSNAEVVSPLLGG